MKFLLFDQKAISALISTSTFQSVDYKDGHRLVDHVCGHLQSELMDNIIVEYVDDGIIFAGVSDKGIEDNRVICYDLTTCNILSEANNPVDLLTVLQKSFRTAMKIWTRQPFSSSERVHETKSIVFPFMMGDKRRIVIERSLDIRRLEKRKLTFPLLAYKYNADDPHTCEESVDTTVLKSACELYIDKYYILQQKYSSSRESATKQDGTLSQIITSIPVTRNDFIFWDVDAQAKGLTESQKQIVEDTNYTNPMRIDGAAGTGKTTALLLRAYKMLESFEEASKPFKIIYFTHSLSTCKRNEAVFSMYPRGGLYLSKEFQQNITFTTLLDYTTNVSNISKDSIIERDANDAKTYQLQLIDDVIDIARKESIIKTYRPLLSQKVKELFDENTTPHSTLCAVLQHEFSIQIKGRTDGLFESYENLESIKNGLPCDGKKDKELIFELYNMYQSHLSELGSYDVDDVTVQALSLLNAPVWRRERKARGYDYVIVDEMHLFNLNEQSIFHFLTKDLTQKQVPICFALDYSQAIGDRGDTSKDYIEYAFGQVVRKKLNTVFRNSPPIADLCSAIAVSGTLMFEASFINPYQEGMQTAFTAQEEKLFGIPSLHMYKSDEDMVYHLKKQIDEMIKQLQCGLNDIGIISFDDKFLSDECISEMTNNCKKRICYGNENALYNQNNDCIRIYSQYDINGLEFKGVILLGVDEGRVPQKVGVGDISSHFIKYSAYNVLYLACSRAKYSLVLMGNELNGVSSCLEHALNTGKIEK